MRALVVPVVCLLSVGCAVQGEKGELPELGDETSPIRWSSEDDPVLMSEQLEKGINSLPRRSTAARPPWPGSYWPTAADSIAYRWAGSGSDSPAAKYERAFGGDDVERQVSQYFGILAHQDARSCTSDFACDRSRGEVCARRRGERTGRCIPGWFGICHAWAAAAALEPEPQGPVTFNGVTFRVNDIKGLISLAYDQPAHRRVSLRCNKDDASHQISYDQYGRPTDAAAECRDTNPGTFHLLLTNIVGLGRQALLEDRAFDAQVWTYPITGYEISVQQAVDAQRANALVGATGSSYRFDPDARYFTQIKVRVDFVELVAANLETDRSLAGMATDSDTLQYVLELDANHEVIGGEWIGESKRRHPDFLWLPTGVGQQSVAGGAIRYADVKQLVDLAANADATGPISDDDPPSDAAQSPQHLDVRGTVATGEIHDYQLSLPAGYAVEVRTEAPGDVDLYLRFNAPPRGRSYDASSIGWTGDEALRFVAPAAGVLYIAVYGFEGSSYHLTTSEAPSAR